MKLQPFKVSEFHSLNSSPCLLQIIHTLFLKMNPSAAPFFSQVHQQNMHDLPAFFNATISTYETSMTTTTTNNQTFISTNGTGSQAPPPTIPTQQQQYTIYSTQQNSSEFQSAKNQQTSPQINTIKTRKTQKISKIQKIIKDKNENKDKNNNNNDNKSDIQKNKENNDNINGKQNHEKPEKPENHENHQNNGNIENFLNIENNANLPKIMNGGMSKEGQMYHPYSAPVGQVNYEFPESYYTDGYTTDLTYQYYQTQSANNNDSCSFVCFILFLNFFFLRVFREKQGFLDGVFLEGHVYGAIELRRFGFFCALSQLFVIF